MATIKNGATYATYPMGYLERIQVHFEHQYFSNSLNAWITVNDAETLAEATVDYPLEGVRNRTVLVLGEQEDTE